MKNCGDPVHSQIVERNILQDMIKIVKKKASFPFTLTNNMLLNLFHDPSIMFWRCLSFNHLFCYLICLPFITISLFIVAIFFILWIDKQDPQFDLFHIRVSQSSVCTKIVIDSSGILLYYASA